MACIVAQTRQPGTPCRAPRLQFAQTTPATVRVQNGRPVRGKLQVVSVTGGLLCLPSLLDKGSQVTVMFLTDAGLVLGIAEMLASISSTQQPFRFLRIDEDHQRRLRELIQASSEQKRHQQSSILSDRAW
jgi:hypothetical protein